MNDNNSRPNRHTNPSKYNRKKKGKFRFIRRKRRETRELAKVIMA